MEGAYQDVAASTEHGICVHNRLAKWPAILHVRLTCVVVIFHILVSTHRATVGINFVAAVVILMPSFPPVYRAMFTFLNITLQNSMACRVYRQLKIGLIRDLEMSSVEDETLGTIRFATNPAQTNYSERRRRSGVSGAEGGHLSKHHP